VVEFITVTMLVVCRMMVVELVTLSVAVGRVIIPVLPVPVNEVG